MGRVEERKVQLQVILLYDGTYIVQLEEML
jgi:hypothetical protein